MDFVRKLHPYGKAIAGAITAAIAATMAAYTDLPPVVGILLTLLGTLVTVYFASNTPAPTMITAKPSTVTEPLPAFAPLNDDTPVPWATIAR